MRYNRIFALVYRLSFAVIALLGVIFNTRMFTNEFSPTTLLYYTTQSNVLALALFVYLAVMTILDIKKHSIKGPSSYAPNLTFILMIDILLTFVIFWVVLAPTMIGSDYNLFSFSNLAVHTFVPLAVLGDYFIFNPDKKIKYRYANYVLIYPLIYASFAMIFGAFKIINYYTFGIGEGPNYFPYFFMDYYLYGGYVIIFILGIASFLFMISNTAFYFINRHQGKLLNKQ